MQGDVSLPQPAMHRAIQVWAANSRDGGGWHAQALSGTGY